MKVLLLVLLSTGCVSKMYLTPGEQCALDGMVLTGTSYGSASGVAVGGGAAVSAGSYSSGYVCGKPASAEDTAAISRNREVIINKSEYNRTTWWRNTLVGAGYCAFLLPGIGALVYFDNTQPNPYP